MIYYKTVIEKLNQAELVLLRTSSILFIGCIQNHFSYCVSTIEKICSALLGLIIALSIFNYFLTDTNGFLDESEDEVEDEVERQSVLVRRTSEKNSRREKLRRQRRTFSRPVPAQSRILFSLAR